jgi:hypothetical protein
VVGAHGGAHGLAEVAQQVPAIGDVHGLRRTAPGAVGVDVGPVAGDHLHAGVVAQPGGERAGVAVGQEIDDGVALEVDQDGAVAAALAPRPLVHPERARHRRLGACRGPGEPQERVGAGGHGEPRREPGSRLAAQGEGDLALDVGEALAAPGGGGAMPGSRSAKVRLGQAGSAQKKRRARSRTATGRPCQGRSARRRS